MPRKALAGTRRAAEQCAGCRHTRIRHTNGGRGSCTGRVYPLGVAKVPTVAKASSKCECPGFTDRKDEN